MKRISPIFEKAIALTGWRRRALLFFLGVLATLTLPPFFVFPLIFISYSGLYLLITHAPNPRRAFADGFWWGWGHYITGIYWFCIALLTDAEKFAWLLPFCLFGLTALIALHPALACWLFTRLRVRGVSRLFLFAAVWTGIEFLRGHWLSGFPWNLPGYALMFSDVPLQTASLIGAYGMSFWAVLLGVAPAAFWDKTITRKKAKIYCATLATLFAASCAWGGWRLHQADTIPENERYVAGVKLRLVQANIAQEYKWDPKHAQAGLQAHVDLTHSPDLEKITHVIWPESAVPYMMQADSPLNRYLGSSIPQGAHLITGTLREEGAGANWQVWNSMVMLDHAGKIVGTYDKSKLVPFGEFLPLRELIPNGWKTPVGDNDFSRGAGMQTLNWPKLPSVSPLICYEVIFPERAASEDVRPEWLLSVTNDAWFGNSTGPYQHFHMARMRAVEQGLPLVRVANTGITAEIDPYGRILAMIPLGQQGILDVRLSRPATEKTHFSEHKNLFMLLLVFVSAGLMLLRRNPSAN